MKKIILALFVFCLFSVTTAMAATTAQKLDPQNTLYLDLKYGRVVIAMRPDIAPKHVARIKQLVRQHFYDGLTFHRVIEGFMAQGGDPTGTGTGGSGQTIPAEFSSVPFTRGTVGMARAGDPNSADSQFFIMFADTPSLNGQYTVWGNVVSGMEYVDKLARCQPDEMTGKIKCDYPAMGPDKIIKMEIAADADKTAAPATDKK